MSEEIELKDFENRVSRHPNRRKLTIISQSPTEIIADIDRADSNVTKEGTKIDADDLQVIINKVNNLEDKIGETAGTFVYVDNQFETQLSFTSNPQTQITNEATTRANFDNNLQSQINANAVNISNINNNITNINTNVSNITNNTTKLQNTQGGFTAGNGSQATAGGAVGMNTTTTSGFAGGHSATSDWGGAIGVNASTQLGGAVGSDAISTNGGAVGSYTKTGNGFAGGYNARTTDSAGNGIDAIQLGAGTNSQSKTLQVYNHNIYNSTDDELSVTNVKLNNQMVSANGNYLFLNNKKLQFGTVLKRGVLHSTNSQQTISIPANAKTIQFIAHSNQSGYYIWGKPIYLEDISYFKSNNNANMYLLDERDVFYRCTFTISYNETTGGSMSLTLTAQGGFYGVGNYLYYVIRD